MTRNLRRSTKTPGTIAATTLAIALLPLTSCSDTPAQGLRTQLRTALGSDAAQITTLTVTERIETRTIVDGTERITWDSGVGGANHAPRDEAGSSWGFTRPLSDWDLDGIVTSLPEGCHLRRPETRVHAVALAGSATYVEAHCGEVKVARIGDHDVAPLPQWWTKESLTTLFEEVQLISGSTQVVDLAVEGSSDHQWFTFTTGSGSQITGKPTEATVQRALGDVARTVPRIIGAGTKPGTISGPKMIDLSTIDPANLEAVLEKAAAATGLDLADATRVEIWRAKGDQLGGQTAVTAYWPTRASTVTLDGQIHE